MANRDRTEFGARMREAREAIGLSQSMVAEKLGISQGTLSELERTAKGTSHIVAFASLYDVSPEWLATGEGLMSTKVTSMGKWTKWPFELISRERWERLTERQKGAVEDAALAKLNEIEASAQRSAPAGGKRHNGIPG